MSTLWRFKLSALTLSLVAFSLLLFALPARAAEGNDTLEQVIPGHYTYNSNAYISGIIVTSEGAVVIDALYNEAAAKRERQAIAATIKAPVRYLVSSTFHDNFTKGNVAYADAIRIGHENYRTDLSDLMKNVPDAERNARLPQVTYRDRVTLNLGGKEIQILHIGRAHTRGDSIVFVPQDRIVYMSELFFYDRFPWMESGYADWINAIDTALKLDADIFVPAHGKMEKDPKASRQALIRFRQILVDARDAVASEIARGATETEAIARVQLAQYKDLSGYQQQREVVVRRIYRSLKGTLD